MFILLGLLVPLLGVKWTAVLLVACVVAYLFYRFVKKEQSLWERKGVPYVKPRFFIGSAKIFKRQSLAELSKDLYDAYPGQRYHGFYQFTLPILIIKDPDLIKQITVKDFNHFVNHRAFADAEADTFWSKNLFASKDDRWHDLRTTLSPSFTSSKMKSMFTLINDCALQFIEYFEKQEKDLLELEMKETLRKYTNDVIATTAFGIKLNSLKDGDNEFYKMGKEGSNFGTIRTLKLFLFGVCPAVGNFFRIRVIPSHIANYFSKIIEDTIQTRKEKNIVRPDMIHLLMEAQKMRQTHEEDPHVDEGFSSVSESHLTKGKPKQEITMEDINSQAFIFFLAGFETVSTFLTFSFYELAVNPDIQSRLREEINGVSSPITYEKLLGLKYLDMVVSEVLRKWPPAILTDRQVSQDFTIEPKDPDEKPLLLEKGITCWITIFGIHRDPRFYPDPEKFDPERFNDENKHKINSSVYVPFGIGPRNCIGSRFALLESKLIIVYILKRFEVVKIEKTVHPVRLDKTQINLNAEGGMWLGLKKISS